MTFNIVAYLIFFTLIAFITIKVGWIFYTNGEHFILELIPEDPHLVQAINKLLLVGYYLLNIGYAAVVVSTWDKVTTAEELIASLSFKAGYVITGLGIIHFNNMIALKLYKKYRTKMLNKISKTKI